MNSTGEEIPPPINNTGATLQIKKFHNFNRNAQEKKVEFRVFFYFLGRKIVETIIFRLKIFYSNGRIIRNLQEFDGESVSSNCTIKNEFRNKIGSEGTGDNIDYDCVAPTTFEKKVTNVTLDTDYSIDIGGELISFNEVNFDKEAAKESANIIETPEFNKAGVLENASVEFRRNSFIISGNVVPSETLNGISTIPMEFIDYSGGKVGAKNISCLVEQIDSNANYKLVFKDTLRTYITNITQARSLDDNLYLKINMNQEETGLPVGTTGIGTDYKKSSSGLSGGAIAGIIIACVVVLLGASITVILLKVPSPTPIDNATATNLQSTDKL